MSALRVAQKPSFLGETIRFLLDMVFNILYNLLWNTQIILFNYFGGFFAVYFMMLGAYTDLI